MIKPSLYIAPSAGDRGRGVFSTKNIARDTVIEIAPVIIMSRAERAILDQTLLHDYIFEWGDQAEQCCMALGYVPLYNHAAGSNCEYEMDYELQQISIITKREVLAGEELFINYNGDWDNTDAVWFESK